MTPMKSAPSVPNWSFATSQGVGSRAPACAVVRAEEGLRSRAAGSGKRLRNPGSGGANSPASYCAATFGIPACRRPVVARLPAGPAETTAGNRARSLPGLWHGDPSWSPCRGSPFGWGSDQNGWITFGETLVTFLCSACFRRRPKTSTDFAFSG